MFRFNPPSRSPAHKADIAKGCYGWLTDISPVATRLNNVPRSSLLQHSDGVDELDFVDLI
jgi:hypothetical protein